MFEDQGGIPDPVRALWTVRKIDGLCWHLGGQPKQVLGCSSTRLYSPSEFARKRLRDLIDIWTQFLAKQVAETRIVIDSAKDTANLASLFQSMQRGINRGPAA